MQNVQETLSCPHANLMWTKHRKDATDMQTDFTDWITMYGIVCWKAGSIDDETLAHDKTKKANLDLHKEWMRSRVQKESININRIRVIMTEMQSETSMGLIISYL